MTNTYRTKTTQDRYEEAIANGHLDSGCRICEDESLAEFEHWRIIDNLFPYDRIAKVNHMLVPKSHRDELALTDEERTELLSLKNGYLNEHYGFVIETLPKRKSIPAHHHIHLIVIQDFED